jgi:hypothetical protein
MEDFKRALEDSRSLCDMGFNGSRFTWSNKRHDDYYFTKERLDRVVANPELASMFPFLLVDVLAGRTSDHSPLFILLKGHAGGQRRSKKLFRYEAWWQKKNGVAKEIKKSWQVKEMIINTWGVLKSKISTTQKVCLQWKQSNMDPTAGLIEKKTLELGALQGEAEVSDLEHIDLSQNEVNELVHLEELKWRQMSRQEWLKNGDKNSKFFHASVNQRRANNGITKIQDPGGTSYSEQAEVV